MTDLEYFQLRLRSVVGRVRYWRIIRRIHRQAPHLRRPYSRRHHTGSACTRRGCTRPAGTYWDRLLCARHMRERQHHMAERDAQLFVANH